MIISILGDFRHIGQSERYQLVEDLLSRSILALFEIVAELCDYVVAVPFRLLVSGGSSGW